MSVCVRVRVFACVRVCVCASLGVSMCLCVCLCVSECSCWRWIKVGPKQGRPVPVVNMHLPWRRSFCHAVVYVVCISHATLMWFTNRGKACRWSNGILSAAFTETHGAEVWRSDMGNVYPLLLTKRGSRFCLSDFTPPRPAFGCGECSDGVGIVCSALIRVGQHVCYCEIMCKTHALHVCRRRSGSTYTDRTQLCALRPASLPGK